MHFFDAHGLTGEDRAEVNLFAAQTDAPAVGDHDGFVVEGIVDVGQALVEARGRLIDLGRALHVQGFVRPFVVKDFGEFIEAGLLLQEVCGRGLGGFFLQGEMHAFVAAILLRMAGLDAFDTDSQPEPPDGELAQMEQRLGGSKRHTVIAADVGGQAALSKKPLKHSECVLFSGGGKSLTGEQKPAGVIGDRERIAILTIAEQEFAFVVGAPQLVGTLPHRQSRSLGTTAQPAAALDQAVAIQQGMDRAFGGDGNAGEPAHEALAEFARTPSGVLALHIQDEVLHLEGKLIAVAIGATASVGQTLKATMLVAVEDLVAGLAGDPELSAELGHGLAIEAASNELQSFVHHRTLLPRHHSLPIEERKCYPCVRYVLSPMCQAAQPAQTLREFAASPRTGASERKTRAIAALPKGRQQSYACASACCMLSTAVENSKQFWNSSHCRQVSHALRSTSSLRSR